MLRTEALTKLTGNNINKKIIVTYPEALFEKVVLPKTLSEQYHSHQNKRYDQS
jgi:transcription-repair coupling factor (superfamily II helicase)